MALLFQFEREERKVRTAERMVPIERWGSPDLSGETVRATVTMRVAPSETIKPLDHRLERAKRVEGQSSQLQLPNFALMETFPLAPPTCRKSKSDKAAGIR